MFGEGMFTARKNRSMSLGDGDELSRSETTEMKVILELETLSIEMGDGLFFHLTTLTICLRRLCCSY